MARAVIERQHTEVKEQQRRISSWNQAIQDLLHDATKRRTPCNEPADATIASPSLEQPVTTQDSEAADIASSAEQRNGCGMPMQPSSAFERPQTGGSQGVTMSSFGDHAPQDQPTGPCKSNGQEQVCNAESSKRRQEDPETQQKAVKKARAGAAGNGPSGQVEPQDQQQSKDTSIVDLHCRPPPVNAVGKVSQQLAGKEQRDSDDLSLDSKSVDMENEESVAVLQTGNKDLQDDEDFLASLVADAEGDGVARSLAECLAEADNILNEL